MDQESLAVRRKALEEERESLRAQLQDYGVNPDDPRTVDLEFDEGFADSAQATAERARVLSIIEGLRSNLAEHEHALRKIERGTYGACERCGRDIDPERLEALPTARLCIDCKQKVG